MPNKKTKPTDAIDVILDEDNDDNIILYNEKDEPVEFEQVALIVYKKKAYALLHPVNGKEHGVDEDEALVFLIERDHDGDSRFIHVIDEEIIDAVFAKYEKLFDEENGED